MFAICAPGLERILTSEIEQLGVAGAMATEGGVAFDGDLPLLYNANLSLRTASRVIVRVANFHADSFHELGLIPTRISVRDALWHGPKP